MKLNRIVFTASLLVAPLLVHAQGNGLNPADILKPLSDSWPTYSGDYSGKRFSVLDQINQSNVNKLTLQWFYKANMTPDPARTER